MVGQVTGNRHILKGLNTLNARGRRQVIFRPIITSYCIITTTKLDTRVTDDRRQQVASRSLGSLGFQRVKVSYPSLCGRPT